MLKIAETFYSIQGEGRFSGVPAYFVRLSGCNLMCSWAKKDGSREPCDTVAVWKQTKEEISPLDLSLRIAAACPASAHVVITGGEPILQQREVEKLVTLLHDQDRFVELETNGTIKSDLYSRFDQVNWSPKMTSAGYGMAFYKKLNVLDFWKEFCSHEGDGYFTADMKTVIGNDHDYEEMKEWVKELGIKPEHVFCMPLSMTRNEMIETGQWLVQKCMKDGFIFSPRLQLLLWDKTVGV